METKAKEFLTVPEVAEILRIPRTRAYELIARNALPATRVSERTIRVNRRELEEHLRQRRTGPQTLQTEEEVEMD